MSTWSISGHRHIGTFDAVSATRLQHKPDEAWPVQVEPGKPIGVQIVRGAVGSTGAANKWALVVDGVTCGHTFATGVSPDDHENVPTCRLPAPFSVNQSEISANTLVRPLAIAVRLEEEALAPESVHVILQQVTHSSERSAQSTQRENEVITIDRVELPTHSSRDTVAHAVSLPYPFAAPPQSALGIVSYREVEKWQENVYAITSQNEQRSKKYEQDKKDYGEAYKQWRQERISSIKHNVGKATTYASEMAVYQTGRVAGDSAAAPTKPMFRKLKNFIKKAPKVPELKPASVGTEPAKERNFVIGGKDLSSAKSLVAIYKELEQLCHEAEQNLGGGKASLKAVVYKMREILIVTKSYVTLAFFETLLVGLVSPMAAVQLERRYLVSEEGEVVEGKPEGAAGRQEVFEKYLKGIGDLEVHRNKSCQFVYDYVPFENRQRTYTSMRVVVDIREFSGVHHVVALEPNAYHGKVAHSVYAGLSSDLAELEKAGGDFLECLFTKRSLIEKVVNEGAASIANTTASYFSWATTFFKNVERTKQTSSFKPRYVQIEDMVNEVFEVHKRIIPVWPEPLPSKLVFEIVQEREEKMFQDANKKENERMEKDTVAISDKNERTNTKEIFRIGYADISDEDYFGNKNEQSLVKDNNYEFDENAPYYSDASEDELGETPQALTADATAKEYAEEDTTFEARDLEEVNKQNEANKKSDADIARIERKYLKDSEALGVRLNVSGGRTLTNTSTLVIRELPQVVRPVRFLNTYFQMPTDVAPPDPNLPVENNDASVLSYIVGIVVGWVAFVNKFYIHNKLMMFMAKIQFTAANAATAAAGVNTLISGMSGVALGGWAGGAALAAAVLYSVGESAFAFTKNAAKLGVQTLYYAGESYTLAVPAGVRVAQSIVAWSRAANQKESQLTKAYAQAMHAARGVPIASSIASGRRAFRMIRERSKSNEFALRGEENVHVMYDVSTNQRYMFAEYYWQTASNYEQIRKLPRLKTSSEWALVPNTTALLLLPPGDVAESVYEVEELRRLPFSKATARTVGTPPALVATSLASISAKAAYRELVGLVRADRFPFASLSGQQLLHSAERVALTLATSAAKLIEAAYGTRAGLTLVDGSDAAWNCLPAGVAARLAVRHISVFSESELLGGPRDQDQFDLLKEHWRMPQRAIMDQFAASFVAEASAALKGGRALGDQSASEAVFSFERVRAMSDDSISAFVVASAFSSVLAERSRVIDQIAMAQRSAETFDYQQTMLERGGTRPRRAAAAWASRRLDIGVVRSWIPAEHTRERSGVDLLVDHFGDVDLKNERATYYCPVGSHINGLPSNTPFGVEDLSNHTVWLRAVSQAAQLLEECVYASPDAVSLSIKATAIAPVGDAQGGLLGYTRHPLAISVGGGGVVSTQLAAAGSYVVKNAPFKGTMLRALAMVEADEKVGKQVGGRVLRMRALAYNADRLKNALDLAASTAAASAVLNVRLPHDEAAVALCFAMALLESEGRPIVHTVQIHLSEDSDPEESKTMLREVGGKCGKALEKGCHVCALSELCASMA